MRQRRMRTYLNKYNIFVVLLLFGVVHIAHSARDLTFMCHALDAVYTYTRRYYVQCNEVPAI